MGDYEMFKTTLMGGFDKDDVMQKVEELKDSAFREKRRLEKELKEKNEKLAELTKRLELKEAQKERLEQDVTEKYQKYVDNYEKIGSIIFNAQIQADAMIKEAETKRDEILQQAETEAQKMREEAEREATERIEKVQEEVNEKLADGKKKYVAVQDEMNEIVELINQAQKRFMSSYKEVHRIVTAMPESLYDLKEPEDTGKLPEICERAEQPEEESFDESEDISEEEMKKMFFSEE